MQKYYIVKENSGKETDGSTSTSEENDRDESYSEEHLPTFVSNSGIQIDYDPRSVGNCQFLARYETNWPAYHWVSATEKGC